MNQASSNILRRSTLSPGEHVGEQGSDLFSTLERKTGNHSHLHPQLHRGQRRSRESHTRWEPRFPVDPDPCRRPGAMRVHPFTSTSSSAYRCTPPPSGPQHAKSTPAPESSERRKDRRGDRREEGRQTERHTQVFGSYKRKRDCTGLLEERQRQRKKLPKPVLALFRAPQLTPRARGLRAPTHPQTLPTQPARPAAGRPARELLHTCCRSWRPSPGLSLLGQQDSRG